MQRQQDLQSNEMNPAALDSHLPSKELRHAHARGREGECERERGASAGEKREKARTSLANLVYILHKIIENGK